MSLLGDGGEEPDDEETEENRLEPWDKASDIIESCIRSSRCERLAIGDVDGVKVTLRLYVETEEENKGGWRVSASTGTQNTWRDLDTHREATNLFEYLVTEHALEEIQDVADKRLEQSSISWKIEKLLEEQQEEEVSG